MHLPRSNEAVRLPSLSAKAIAPVGQAAAAGRASFQFAKSISGLSRARVETSGGVAGYPVVTTPVFKLLRRTSNIKLNS